MHHLADDLRFALRYLARRPGFALAALLTLALAIGATTAVFSLVYSVLLRPLELPRPERLVMLFEDHRARGGPEQEVTGITTVRDWRQQTQAFAGVAGSWNNSDGRVALATAAGAEAVVFGRVSPGYFAVLGVAPARGRGFLSAEEVEGQDAVAVLSHELWRRAFAGDPGVLGRKVRVDGVPRAVVGVMPRGFRDPLVPRAGLWVPLSQAAGDDDRGNSYVRVVARLRDGVSLEQAQAQLSGVMRGLASRYPDDYPGVGATVAPLQRVLVGNGRTPGLALFGAVLLVLLIASVNLANLLLARATERGREMAVRTAMGAARGRLVGQLLTESLLLAGLGGVAGLAVGAVLLRLLVRLAPAGMPRLAEVALYPPVLFFALGATLVVGLLFGLLPAARTARTAPAQALRREGGGVVRDSSGGLRRGLIVTEIGISLALLVGAGLLVRTLLALGGVDPGFTTERLIAAQVVLPEERYPETTDVMRVLTALEERLRALPGVRQVATTSALPLIDYYTDAGVRVEGVETNDPPSVQFAAVTTGFFATFGVPLRAGRALDTRDGTEAPRTVVVDEEFARRFLAGGEPLGRRVKLGGSATAPWRTVVGVVGAVHHGGLSRAAAPQIYLPEAQVGLRGLELVVRAERDPRQLLAAVRGAVSEVDPQLPVMQLRTGDDLLAGQLAMPRFVGVLLGGFAALALALALVGIYGVMSLLVAQRRREIGVRLALGARPAEVLGLVLRETTLLALAGVGVGAALALVLARGLGGLLFGVQPADPATLAGAVALVLAAALLATAGPARRAASLDLMRALREE